MSPAPIKRHQALQPFSREHHDGLLLSWKIKQGLKRCVEIARIKRYTDWFWQAHLKPHFEAEEQYIFPILRDDDELVVQALSEHQQLGELFHLDTPDTDSLMLIADLLNHHIRFEERILFAKIQEVATPEQMLLVEQYHSDDDSGCTNWEDEFWV